MSGQLPSSSRRMHASKDVKKLHLSFVIWGHRLDLQLKRHGEVVDGWDASDAMVRDEPLWLASVVEKRGFPPESYGYAPQEIAGELDEAIGQCYLYWHRVLAPKPAAPMEGRRAQRRQARG